MGPKTDLHRAVDREQPHPISAEKQDLPVVYRRNSRAKRYILAVRGNGTVTVTVPRGGSLREAEAFLASRRHWLDRVLGQIQAQLPPKKWTVGSQILFRGEWVSLEVVEGCAGGGVRLGSQLFRMDSTLEDLRPPLERELRRIADVELRRRVEELAHVHGSPVRRILIRGQRSRWGSCSCRGTISLNWRLIQTPPEVRDYIILHELMHFREMNHSRRFWQQVQAVCPNYRAAESWLSNHRFLLEQ